MSSDEPQPGTMQIDKTMTLSASEFEKSIHGLTGGDYDRHGIDYIIKAGNGTVRVSYTPIAPISFGGLVDLPRGDVALVFAGVSETERNEFMRRFDISFQRGGG